MGIRMLVIVARVCVEMFPSLSTALFTNCDKGDFIIISDESAKCLAYIVHEISIVLSTYKFNSIA